MTENTNDRVLLDELDRRIKAIEALDDKELGSFGKLDWAVLILIALVIPVIALVVTR